MKVEELTAMAYAEQYLKGALALRKHSAPPHCAVKWPPHFYQQTRTALALLFKTNEITQGLNALHISLLCKIDIDFLFHLVCKTEKTDCKCMQFNNNYRENVVPADVVGGAAERVSDVDCGDWLLLFSVEWSTVSASSVELCSDAERATCSPLPPVDWTVVSLAVYGRAGAVGFTDRPWSISCESENIS